MRSGWESEKSELLSSLREYFLLRVLEVPRARSFWAVHFLSFI